MLMSGLARLIDADGWLWSMSPGIRGDRTMVYASFVHGGFSDDRLGACLSALEHPDMERLQQGRTCDAAPRQKPGGVPRRLECRQEQMLDADVIIGELAYLVLGPQQDPLEPGTDRDSGTRGARAGDTRDSLD